MCDRIKKIPIPREIAKKYLKNYYGNHILYPIDQYKNSYHGCSCYGVSIGMHVSDGNNYGNDKIVVEIKKDRPRTEIHIFSKKEIYREAMLEARGIQQLRLL